MGDVYTNPPQSRNEAILRATIDGTEYTDPPQSRIEDLLLELKKAIEEGGGTGEGDMKKSVYDSDNSVASAGGIKMFVNQKIGTLPQKVGTVEGKVTTLEGQMLEVENDLDNLGTASTKNSTSVVTDSTDLVESGAVKDIVGWGNKNLFDPANIRTEVIATYVPIYVGSGTFTMSTNMPINTQGGANLFILAGNVSTGASTATNGLWSGQTRTVTAIDGYVTVASRNTDGVNPVDYNHQLEKGSTATAYEPYHASVEETIPQVVSDAFGWDVGNLIPMTITAMKAVNTLGTWNGNIYTLNSVTFEPNVLNNGVVDSIKINGTPSQWTQLYLSNAITLPVGNYVLSSKNNIPNNVYLTYVSFGQGSALSQNQNLKYVSITTPASNMPYVGLEGITVTNLVVYPVIRNLNVNERKADNSVIGTVEDGTNPTKDYAVGEHMIRGGKFCTVTVPVTTASTWVEGNNYTIGDVASAFLPVLKKKQITVTTSANGNADISNFINTGNQFLLAVTAVIKADYGRKVVCIPYLYSGINDGIIRGFKCIDEVLGANSEIQPIVNTELLAYLIYVDATPIE